MDRAMEDAMMERLLNAPALLPPPGVAANFESPQSTSRPGVFTIQLIACTIVVGMRIYTKVGIVKKVLAEDYALSVSWLFFVGLSIVALMAERLPMGVHQWDLTVRKAIQHGRLFHFGSAMYCSTVVPLKASLILQIRRIFIPHTRSLSSRPLMLWTIDGFLVLNIIFYAILIMFEFLSCNPVAHGWNPLIPGTCVKNRIIIHIVSPIINLVSDFIIVILPQPVIWRLQLSRKRKWGLSAVFMLGSLACAASAVRVYYSVDFYRSPDQTYYGALMCYWGVAEVTFGFMAACLPVLPTFIKHISNTPLGRRFSTLWTHGLMNKPKPSQGNSDGSIGNHANTIGNQGRNIENNGRGAKVGRVDIDFQELTRESTDAVEALEVRSTKSSGDRDEEWIAGIEDLQRQCSVEPLRV